MVLKGTFILLVSLVFLLIHSYNYNIEEVRTFIEKEVPIHLKQVYGNWIEYKIYLQNKTNEINKNELQINHGKRLPILVSTDNYVYTILHYSPSYFKQYIKQKQQYSSSPSSTKTIRTTKTSAERQEQFHKVIMGLPLNLQKEVLATKEHLSQFISTLPKKIHLSKLLDERYNEWIQYKSYLNDQLKDIRHPRDLYLKWSNEKIKIDQMASRQQLLNHQWGLQIEKRFIENNFALGPLRSLSESMFDEAKTNTIQLLNQYTMDHRDILFEWNTYSKTVLDDFIKYASNISAITHLDELQVVYHEMSIAIQRCESNLPVLKDTRVIERNILQIWKNANNELSYTPLQKVYWKDLLERKKLQMNILVKQYTFTKHQTRWPYLNNTKYHNPEEFANAGFYNIATNKNKDVLKCYLCNIKLNRWKEGQSPLARHALASPTCPLVLLNFPDALTTIPFIEADPNTYPESATMTTARLKTFTTNKAWPPLTIISQSNSNTTVTQPSTSSSSSSRRLTRSSTSSIKQKPYPTSTKLAEAGFIYLPTEKEHDRVFCPYCHCTLSNLRGVTNSFTQHQKLKANCFYITRWQTNRKKPSIPRKRSLPAEQSNKNKSPTLSLPPSKRTKSSSTVVKPSSTKRTREESNDKDNHNINDDHDMNNNDNDNNISDNELNTALDDSIWDIAKADIEKQHYDLSQKRTKNPNTKKTLVTYSRKGKVKKEILPPELTKTIPPLPSLPSSSPSSSSKQITSSTAAAITSAIEESDNAIINIPSNTIEETPAQVLSRLGNEKIGTTITKKDKGKGRAIDSLPTENRKSSTNRPSLNKIIQNEKERSINTNNNSSSNNMNASSPASASTTLSATVLTSSPILSSNNHPYPLFSLSLAQSTPINSRIDGDDDLFKLTLSPIRPIEGRGVTTTNRQHGVFDNLNTPMTRDSRLQHQSKETDIQKQIVNRFRSKKKPLSPTSMTLEYNNNNNNNNNNNINTNNNSNSNSNNNKFTLFEDSVISSPTLSPIMSSFELPNPISSKDTSVLTEDELKMTVEEFINSIVEKKITIVKQRGEFLIKTIEEEVRNTKNSLSANQ
ncbi:unnamed protein product [Cunninghamella blakesleeana]